MKSIAIMAGLAAAGAAFLSGAQASEDYITACREAHVNPDDRIACLEDAIAQLTGAERVASALKDENATQPPAAEIEAPTGFGAEQVAAREDRQRERNGENTPKDKEDERLLARVTEYAVAADGSYILFLENGHVWRQTGKANGRLRLYPRKEYTVKIKKGALSGYRVTINEVKRTFAAERVK